MSSISMLEENGYKQSMKGFNSKRNKLVKVASMLNAMRNGSKPCSKANIRNALSILYQFKYFKCDIGDSDINDLIEFLEKAQGVLDPELIRKILAKSCSFSIEPKSYKNDRKVFIPYIEMIDNMNLVTKKRYETIVL